MSLICYTQSHKKEVIEMPKIKPISDLRNYSEVLNDVAVGSPVFLTKNGRGKYAIIDIDEYEKVQAKLSLMDELLKGRTSGDERGWISAEDIRREFMVCETDD